MSVRSVVDALRRPAYTGERRCWPCTLLNGALLACSTVWLARRGHRALAVALAAVGTASIALRGYFVPYTPRFAPRLAAALSGDSFDVDHVGTRVSADPGPAEGKGSLVGASTPPDTPGSTAEGMPAGDDVLAALLEAEVLVSEGESLFLREEAEARWRAEMDALRPLDPETLAATVADATPRATEAAVVENDGEEWIVLDDRRGPAGQAWLSRPVAIAEAAAVRALYELAPGLPAETRIAAARPMRMFLKTCPACGGPVTETTTAACCGGVPLWDGPDDVLACEACNRQLFTFGS